MRTGAQEYQCCWPGISSRCYDSRSSCTEFTLVGNAPANCRFYTFCISAFYLTFAMQQERTKNNLFFIPVKRSKGISYYLGTARCVSTNHKNA